VRADDGKRHSPSLDPDSLERRSVKDIVPSRRVVIASTMAVGEKCISAALVTFELLSADGGSDLIVTHQGEFFEGADGPQIREGGWRYLLEQLANEVARS